MPTGTVVSFKPETGYGFIRPDDRGPDVFVHSKGLKHTGLDWLEEGMRVRYRLVKNLGRIVADDIVIVGR